MAKLIALCLLLTHHVRLLPDPFLPFLPFLDEIAPGLVFQRTLQSLFIVSALALLFNRRVRLASAVLGGTILLGVLASKAYYGNNKTFCGLILLLTGLYRPGSEPWLLRLQIVIVYFGAGLNKLLDPDWQSGQFFDYWATARLKNPAYTMAAALLPPLVAAKILCWTTIITELGLAAAFLRRQLWPLAIWVSLLFHASLLLFTGSTFTMFFYAMQASMLVFVQWPRSQALVIYDGDCGFCARVRSWWERLDLEQAFAWMPFQSGVGGKHGISEGSAREHLHLVVEGRIYTGFRAFQLMLLYNPLTYFAIAVALATPPAGAALYRRIVVSLLLAFFLPPFRPVGEAAYRLVARNRYRIPPGSHCRVG